MRKNKRAVRAARILKQFRQCRHSQKQQREITTLNFEVLTAT